MRHSTMIAAVASVLAAITSLAAWRPVPHRESDNVRLAAQAWVAGNRTALPTSFEAFANQSTPIRRAAYAVLAWPQREALWRTHLQSFLLPVAVLSPAQRRTASEVGALSPRQRTWIQLLHDSVVPQAFAPDLTIDQRQAIAASACRSTEALLGREKSRILGRIGPIDSAWQNLLMKESQAARRFSGPETASLIPNFWAIKRFVDGRLASFGWKRGAVNCDCHVSSACDCPGGQYCVNSGSSIIPGACGCLNLYVCDGKDCEDPF